MKLKSDAIPGSGNSLAGIIDRDIAYDKYGLPYIPAKRVKGILRESAEELGFDEDAVFGVEGREKGCDFRIDNGYLEGYREYKELLSSISGQKKITEFLPQQAVLDYFTYTRSQTTIEDGIAKENSLRVSRVLKKGLIFDFNVEYNEKYQDNLKDICKVTRGFGASRTRGFGEIELTLENSSENNTSPTVNFSSTSADFAKMTLIVENKGQLLISAKPGKSHISEDFITGSTLLGAVAANYIKKNSVDENFKKLFLSGKIFFGNLYPAAQNGQSPTFFYPSPLSVKKIKENKTDHHVDEFYDHSELDIHDDILNNAIFKGGFPDFVSASNDKNINIIKNIEAHHRRPSDRHIAKSTKKNGDFFQFEIIEADQKFAGEITGEESLLNELCKYFPENGELRLGKSKTGQYGKCEYKLENPVKISEEKFEWDDGDEEKFIFRSDMILLNENGFAVPDMNLFKKEIAKRFGVNPEDFEIIKQFSKTTNTGGFLGIWKMPRIQKPAICAGTVVVLKNNSGKNLEAENIEKIRFGDRIEDGFGRIALYKNENSGLSNPVEEEPEFSELNAYSFEKAPDKIKELVCFRIIKIVKQHLQSKAVKKAESIPIKSFIEKLVSYLKNSESFEDFNKKIKELKSKKQEDNLKKIAEKLFIKSHEIVRNNFSNEVKQSQGRIPEEIIKKFKIEPSFELYKHYALAYLRQVKYNNRKGGK